MHRSLAASKPTSRILAWALLASLALLSSGCAAIFGKQKQVVTLQTNPPQRSVIYGKFRYADGQSIKVEKTAKAPQINVGTPETPVMVNMKYKADLWLIGDIFTLGVGFIVDFATGAWRNIEDPQVVNVPASALTVPKPAATPAPTPAPTATPKPAAKKPRPKSSKPKTEEPDTSTSPIAP